MVTSLANQCHLAALSAISAPAALVLPISFDNTSHSSAARLNFAMVAIIVVLHFRLIDRLRSVVLLQLR
jgi:hypothetical protein